MNKNSSLIDKIKKILSENFNSTSIIDSPTISYSNKGSDSSYKLKPEETLYDVAKKLNIPFSPILKKLEYEDLKLISKLIERFRKTGNIEISFQLKWQGPLFEYIIEFLGMEYKDNGNDKAMIKLMDIFDATKSEDVRKMLKNYYNGTRIANEGNSISDINSEQVMIAVEKMKKIQALNKEITKYLSSGNNNHLFRFIINRLQLRFYGLYNQALDQAKKAKQPPKELTKSANYAKNYNISDIQKYLYKGNEENFIKFNKANKEALGVLKTQKINPKYIAVIDGIIDGKLDMEEMMEVYPGAFRDTKDVARTFSQAIRETKVAGEIIGDFLDRTYKKYGLNLPSTKTWTTKDITSNQDPTKKLKDDNMGFAFTDLHETRSIVRSVLKEFMTKGELNRVEDYADNLFNNVGIDVEFTTHFIDRLNDPRNGKDIESMELNDLFKKLYEKYGQKMPTLRKGTEALVNDVNSNINIPFTLVWDNTKKEFNMVNKTIMRTKNFYSNDMKLKV